MTGWSFSWLVADPSQPPLGSSVSGAKRGRCRRRWGFQRDLPRDSTAGRRLDCCDRSHDRDISLSLQPQRLEDIKNGEGGIRTLVKVAPKQHFQCCAFNHSATSPGDLEIFILRKRYLTRPPIGLGSQIRSHVKGNADSLRHGLAESQPYANHYRYGEVTVRIGASY